MKQECIDILKMYIEKQSPNQLNERMLNKILACAKLYDNAEDLIDCIKILKNEIFQKIISFEEKKFMEDIKLIMAIKELKTDEKLHNLLERKSLSEIEAYLRDKKEEITFSEEQSINILKNHNFGIHHTSTASIEAIKQEGLKTHKRSDLKNSKMGELISKLGLSLSDVFLNAEQNDGIFYTTKFIMQYSINSPEWFDRLVLCTTGYHIGEINKKTAQKELEVFLNKKDLTEEEKLEMREIFTHLFNKYLEKEPAFVFINDEKQVENVDDYLHIDYEQELVQEYLKMFNCSKSQFKEDLLKDYLMFGNINESYKENIPAEKLTIAVCESKQKTKEIEDYSK